MKRLFLILSLLAIMPNIFSSKLDVGVKTGAGIHDMFTFNFDGTTIIDSYQKYKPLAAYEVGFTGSLTFKSKFKLCADLMVINRNYYSDNPLSKYNRKVSFYHLKNAVYIMNSNKSGFHFGFINYLSLHDEVFYYLRFKYNIGLMGGYHINLSEKIALNFDLQTDLTPTGYRYPGSTLKEQDKLYFSYGFMINVRYNFISKTVKQ